MKYYMIYSLDGATPLGVACSGDFRYINEKGKMMCCDESEAQFIYVKGKIYHADDLLPEPEEFENKYETVKIVPCTLEEIGIYQRQKAKEELQKLSKILEK